MEEGNPESGSGIPQFLNSSIPQFERPTFVRYGVLASLTAMAIILYLDRVCISVAVREIAPALRLTPSESEWVLSAFFLAYALGQIPTGWLGDRAGARWMLTGSMLVWSLFTALTGLAWDLASLLGARFLFGLGQAGAY